jgi:antirestriction protein ArdC
VHGSPRRFALIKSRITPLRWLDLLKEDKRAFFTACNRASKAAEYLRAMALAEPTATAA